MSPPLQKDYFEQALFHAQKKGPVKSTEPKPQRPCSSYPCLLPWEWLLCTFEALWNIFSLLALCSALHHLGGCLNSSVQTFSHCLLIALFRAGPAAPRCILKGPHPLCCGSYKEHCYTLGKINILSWMKNVTITAVKPVNYSTLFKIRKHQFKDHVQFWASCEKDLRSRKHHIQGKLGKKLLCLV